MENLITGVDMDGVNTRMNQVGNVRIRIDNLIYGDQEIQDGGNSESEDFVKYVWGTSESVYFVKYCSVICVSRGLYGI